MRNDPQETPTVGPRRGGALEEARKRWESHLAEVGTEGIIAEVNSQLSKAEANWTGFLARNRVAAEFSHPSSSDPLGRRVLDFAVPAMSQQWLKRRVEQLHLINDRTVQRRVTFEVDLGGLPQARLPIDNRGVYFLPLTRLDRQSNTSCEVVAEGFRELHRATLAAERRLVCDGLTSRWAEAGFGEGTIKLIEQAVLEPPARGRALLGGQQAPATILADLVNTAREDTQHSRPPSSEVILSLLRDVERWQRRHLLIAEVPAEAFQNGQAVLVLTYQDAVSEQPLVSSILDFRFRRYFGLIRKVLAGSMSSSLRIPVPGVGDSESAHVTLTAPPGFRAVDAALRVVDAQSEVALWFRDDNRLPASAHVTFHSRGRLIRDAQFLVSFYSYKTGFFIESLISSIVLWILLQITYDRLAHLRFDLPRFNATANPLSGVILVLLLPALIVVLITQRDQHRLASRCFAIPRLLLVISSLGSIAAATSLTLQVSPGTARDVWRVAVIVAAAVAIRTTLSALVHLWRLSLIRNTLVARTRAYRDALANAYVEGGARHRLAPDRQKSTPQHVAASDREATRTQPEGADQILDLPEGATPPGRFQRTQFNSWEEFPSVESSEEVWPTEDDESETLNRLVEKTNGPH